MRAYVRGVVRCAAATRTALLLLVTPRGDGCTGPAAPARPFLCICDEGELFHVLSKRRSQTPWMLVEGLTGTLAGSKGFKRATAFLNGVCEIYVLVPCGYIARIR